MSGNPQFSRRVSQSFYIPILLILLQQSARWMSRSSERCDTSRITEISSVPCAPQFVFEQAVNGGRTAAGRDDLSKISPVEFIYIHTYLVISLTYWSWDSMETKGLRLAHIFPLFQTVLIPMFARQPGV